jgi:hypothetical protein
MLYCAAVPLKPMGFKLALVRDICCKGWPRGCGDKGVFLEACVGDLGIRKSVLSMHYKYSREATETRVFAVEFGWVSLALGGGSGVCLSVSVSVSVSMCVFVSVPVCVCLCVCVCVRSSKTHDCVHKCMHGKTHDCVHANIMIRLFLQAVLPQLSALV